MERVYRVMSNPIPSWMPHEYILNDGNEASELPVQGVPAGSVAYAADSSRAWRLSPAGQWVEIEMPTISVIGDAAISVEGHTLVIASPGGEEA